MHRALARGELRLVYVAPERLANPEFAALPQDARRSACSRSTRRIASRNGATISGRSTERSPRSAALSAAPRSSPSPRPPTPPPAPTSSPAVPGAAAKSSSTASTGRTSPRHEPAQRQAAASCLEFVAAHRGESGIVYCSSRTATEELAGVLARDGVNGAALSRRLDPADRTRHQDVFLQEDGVVMVATIAFGMGIDKPDVRFVVPRRHAGSVEGYYQEIGRAGRDGLPADTLTLYGLDDIALRRRQIEESTLSDEQKRIERMRLNALMTLCESPRCRRQTLLRYFGETAGPCGNCDVCGGGVAVIDGTIAAQKAMSAILRTGERFGTEHLVGLLLGEETEAIRKFGHDRLPTFGVGKDNNRNAVALDLPPALRRRDSRSTSRASAAGPCSDAGREVLRGKATIELRQDVVTSGKKAARKAVAAVALEARRPTRTSSGAAGAPLGARQGAGGARLCGAARPQPDRHGAPQAREPRRDGRGARHRRGQARALWRGVFGGGPGLSGGRVRNRHRRHAVAEAECQPSRTLVFVPSPMISLQSIVTQEGTSATTGVKRQPSPILAPTDSTAFALPSPPTETLSLACLVRSCLEMGNRRGLPGRLCHSGMGQLHPRSQRPAGHSLGSGPRRGVCPDGVCRPSGRIDPVRGSRHRRGRRPAE